MGKGQGLPLHSMGTNHEGLKVNSEYLVILTLLNWLIPIKKLDYGGVLNSKEVSSNIQFFTSLLKN
jgi:hypothetical protein